MHCLKWFLDERRLQLHLDILTRRQKTWNEAREKTKFAFSYLQDKKKHSWQREDDARLMRLNFPALPAASLSSSPSVETVRENGVVADWGGAFD